MRRPPRRAQSANSRNGYRERVCQIRAGAGNASRFLDKIDADMPFSVRAIQVDGASGFMADFERACMDPRSDPLRSGGTLAAVDGHVERSDGIWRHEFCALRNLPDDLDDPTAGSTPSPATRHLTASPEAWLRNTRRVSCRTHRREEPPRTASVPDVLNEVTRL